MTSAGTLAGRIPVMRYLFVEGTALSINLRGKKGAGLRSRPHLLTGIPHYRLRTTTLREHQMGGTRAAWIAAMATALSIGALAAQQPAGHEQMPMSDGMPMMEGDAMASDPLMTAHMTMSPRWPEAPGDRSRADSLVAVVRAALAKYRDVRVAEQDGYKMFAPKIKRQRVYHYTRTANAIKARWTFDASAPTSLLYQPAADGGLRLVGAMYTAPASMTLEDLNRRLPLSIAQWHQHTNLCMPPGTGRLRAGGDQALASRDQRFGLRGTIATAEACSAAGGEFHERVFGWMAHVNMFADDSELWEHRH